MYNWSQLDANQLVVDFLKKITFKIEKLILFSKINFSTVRFILDFIFLTFLIQY